MSNANQTVFDVGKRIRATIDKVHGTGTAYRIESEAIEKLNRLTKNTPTNVVEKQIPEDINQINNDQINMIGGEEMLFDKNKLKEKITHTVDPKTIKKAQARAKIKFTDTPNLKDKIRNRVIAKSNYTQYASEEVKSTLSYKMMLPVNFASIVASGFATKFLSDINNKLYEGTISKSEAMKQRALIVGGSFVTDMLRNSLNYNVSNNMFGLEKDTKGMLKYAAKRSAKQAIIKTGATLVEQKLGLLDSSVGMIVNAGSIDTVLNTVLGMKSVEKKEEAFKNNPITSVADDIHDSYNLWGGVYKILGSNASRRSKRKLVVTKKEQPVVKKVSISVDNNVKQPTTKKVVVKKTA